MQPHESLLCRLSKYPASAKVRPLENFATELLAWTINRWKVFGVEFAGLFMPDRARDIVGVHADTQFAVPNGFVDLTLKATLREGGSEFVLVESKVETVIGLRAAPDDDDASGGPQDSTGPYTQIDTYLSYAKEHGALVGLLTKYPVDVSDVWRASHWAGHRRWSEIAKLLREIAKGNDVEHFLAEEITTFLREHGMTIERVEGVIRDGTRNLIRMQSLLDEAANSVCTNLGLSWHSARTDRFATSVTIKDREGRTLGGPGYSLGQGDTAVWIDREWITTRTTTDKLKAMPALEQLHDAGGDRWWGNPYVPLVALDEEFFTLDGESQLARITDQLQEVIGALVEATAVT